MPRWIDLSRFDASLKVLPASPLRGSAATVLEINDRYNVARHRGLPADLSAERVQEERIRLQEDLNFLGFTEPAQNGPYREDQGMSLVWYSPRSRFTLSDLQRLYPGLTADDSKDMPIEDVVVSHRPTSELAQAWGAFTAEVLTADAKSVWTPRINPYDKPQADSPDILTANPQVQMAGTAVLHPLIRHMPHAYAEVTQVLARAHYRTNALVPYYADKATALADGWNEAELEQRDLPYALPLWVTGQGKIIALRDVRYATEIMGETPQNRVGRAPTPVQALRALPALVAALEANQEAIAGWAHSPGTLQEPQALTEALQRQATVLQEAEKRFFGRRVSRMRTAFWQPETGQITPPTTWSPSQIENAAGLLSDYGVAGGNVNAVRTQITGAIDAAKSVSQAHALAAAQSRLRAMTDRVQSEEATVDERTVHVDAGEKIGGARKDFARHALSLDDLLTMNGDEKAALVLKKNVWPPLDYAALRDAGVTSHAAMAIKVLKDALNTQPDRRRSSAEGTTDPESDYIRSIAYVRDALAGVDTLEAFGQAMGRLYDYGITIPGSDYKHERGITGCTSTQVQWGSKASELIWRAKEGYMPSAIRKAIQRKLGEDPANWGGLITEKKTRSEQELDAAKEKDAVDRELHRPHLEKVERYGADWRNGRDMLADDLIQHFGFRGVEFGNWLPQDERQQVLNMAFDSLCDLADALDLPPEGLSLNGKLAIAFGSRGRGGRHAALAHFEPARWVFNLTRMNGAGALAHEWTHALDYHLGDGKSAAEHATVNTALGALVQSMLRRPTEPGTLFDKSKANWERGRDNVFSWLYLQPVESRGLLKDINVAAFAGAEAEFLAAARLAIQNPNHHCHQTHGAVGLDRLMDAEKEIMDTIKKACPHKPGFTKVKTKIEGNVGFAMAHLAIACTITAFQEAGRPVPKELLGGSHSESTDFLRNAKKLDTTRSTPYWATVRELFARAGAAYVSDRLTDKGVRSDYLVYGAEADRYERHSVGNPNPTGEDRQVLAERFDALMAEVRLRLTADHAPRALQA